MLVQISASQGVEKDALGVEAIKKILIQQEGALIGDISEVSKFATLKELDIVKGESKNWNEVLVKVEGGALGLISKCLIEIAGEDSRSKMVDDLIEEDQSGKAKIVLEEAKIAGKKEEFTNLLEPKIEVVKSEEMKNLVNLFVAETPSE